MSLDSTLNASDLSLDTTTEIIDGADSTSGNENNEQTGKAIVSLLLGAMLETRWELEPKCVPKLFLGLLLETCRSAIGQFFFCLSPVTVPRSLCGS